MPENGLPAFLAGTGTDARGRTAAEIIAMSDAELERYHDWVQWLFPLPAASAAVPGSPVLSREDVQAIRCNPVAVETLRRTADRMVAFLRDNDHWLTTYDHNHMRITRIITSLGLLVGPDQARRVFDEIAHLNESAGGPVNAKSVRYWREALARSEGTERGS